MSVCSTLQHDGLSFIFVFFWRSKFCSHFLIQKEYLGASHFLTSPFDPIAGWHLWCSDQWLPKRSVQMVSQQGQGGPMETAGCWSPMILGAHLPSWPSPSEPSQLDCGESSQKKTAISIALFQVSEIWSFYPEWFCIDHAGTCRNMQEHVVVHWFWPVLKHPDSLGHPRKQ